jgi:hypothetical protein
MSKIKITKSYHDNEFDRIIVAGEIVEVGKQRALELCRNPNNIAVPMDEDLKKELNSGEIEDAEIVEENEKHESRFDLSAPLRSKPLLVALNAQQKEEWERRIGDAGVEVVVSQKMPTMPTGENPTRRDFPKRRRERRYAGARRSS